jgi:gas vesicle protein
MTRGTSRSWTARLITHFALAPLALALLAGSASLASADDDALQGPAVKDRSMPGETRQFSPGARDGKGARKDQRGMPHLAFGAGVRWLGSDEAPADVRLSDDQQTKIKAIHDEFRGQLKAYRDDHARELDTIMDELPERAQQRLERFLSGEPGGPGEKAGKGAKPPKGERAARREPPPAMDGDDVGMGAPPTQEQQAAMEKLKELMDGAPKPTEAHAKIAALLSDAQKKALESKVQEIESTMSDRQGQRRERAAKALKELTPEQREKFKNMSPEERKAAIQKRRQQKTPSESQPK